MSYREIEIRGLVMPRRLDSGTAYRTHEGWWFHGRDAVSTPDVLAALHVARAAGVRVLLVTIDSLGGEFGSSLALYAALRAFSDAGGTVVVFLAGVAGSSAVILAAAGDLVVMAPEARYILHGARTGDGRPPNEINAELVRILASRTCSPRETLEEAIRDPEELTAVTAEQAPRLGWADAVGTLEDARRIARRVAAVGRPNTPRARALAGRV